MALEVAELDVTLTDSLGVTRLDRIEDSNIQTTAYVESTGLKVGEVRFWQYGHEIRKNEEYVKQKMDNIPTRKNTKIEGNGGRDN